jgi:hypothetical protein
MIASFYFFFVYLLQAETATAELTPVSNLAFLSWQCLSLFAAQFCTCEINGAKLHFEYENNTKIFVLGKERIPTPEVWPNQKEVPNPK